MMPDRRRLYATVRRGGPHGPPLPVLDRRPLVRAEVLPRTVRVAGHLVPGPPFGLPGVPVVRDRLAARVDPRRGPGADALTGRRHEGTLRHPRAGRSAAGFVVPRPPLRH